MVFKLKTSKETMKIFEEIGAGVHLQAFVLCKLAIALSLRSEIPLAEKDFKHNTDGLELNRQTITGEYDDLFKSILKEVNSERMTSFYTTFYKIGWEKREKVVVYKMSSYR